MSYSWMDISMDKNLKVQKSKYATANLNSPNFVQNKLYFAETSSKTSSLDSRYATAAESPEPL
jgi:hypothetical protein